MTRSQSAPAVDTTSRKVASWPASVAIHSTLAAATMEAITRNLARCDRHAHHDDGDDYRDVSRDD